MKSANHGTWSVTVTSEHLEYMASHMASPMLMFIYHRTLVNRGRESAMYTNRARIHRLHPYKERS